jgi:hypothetical protein
MKWREFSFSIPSSVLLFVFFKRPFSGARETPKNSSLFTQKTSL